MAYDLAVYRFTRTTDHARPLLMLITTISIMLPIIWLDGWRTEVVLVHLYTEKGNCPLCNFQKEKIAKNGAQLGVIQVESYRKDIGSHKKCQKVLSQSASISFLRQFPLNNVYRTWLTNDLPAWKSSTMSRWRRGNVRSTRGSIAGSLPLAFLHTGYTHRHHALDRSADRSG